MATKDITDAQVCRAVHESRADLWASGYPYDLLMTQTGECLKVCYRAMERADARGLLEYGVSLRTAWLTEAGLALIGGTVAETEIE